MSLGMPPSRASAIYMAHALPCPHRLTVLLYLAYEPQKGGELRALNCPNRDPPEWDIAPVPGRLCVFYAQEIEHMVLESTGHRMALTVCAWGCGHAGRSATAPA